MAAPDVNALFARAEAAFRAGRYDAARADLLQVLRVAGDHPAVLHLLALTEKAAGRVPAAGAAFRRALAGAPNDPQINNNYANLLDAAGDQTAALSHYARALATQPGFAEARRNRAATLQALDRLDEALADLDALIAADPRDARALTARGNVHRRRGALDRAAADFAAVLAISDQPAALHGAARTAMERGDEGAAALYRRALSRNPGDRELLLGLAEALEAAGEPGGEALLAEALAADPGWLAGHDSLARMRSEAGDRDNFAASFAPAISARPTDRALHFAHWRCLARGDRHAEALAALDAAALGDDVELRLTAAVLASEAGDLDRADAAMAGLGDGDQARLARGRHALRRSEPALAATLLEPVVRNEPGLVTAWAHLALAWRLLGDVRHDWLCGQPGLYGARELGLSDAELAELATVLRGLHRTRAHPIGQSLRGGTQTRGRLFARREPEIVALRERLRGAIGDYIAALPARDPRHPLLRHRDARLDFDGSWSVRLAGGGFHVNHIHPEGVLSSACYIALPGETTGGERAGWLEIGGPPVELGLGLPPLATIEPRPGRLALFPSYLFHGTRPFVAGERLTVAFDVAA